MGVLPLKCLNHISKVVHDCEASIAFYVNVLGFDLIKRPSSFNFQGAWLHSSQFHIGIHLIGGGPQKQPRRIDPHGEHLSFQAGGSIEEIQSHLQALKIPYLTEKVFEDGLCVTQLFFHDPDQSMIEICNCEALPIIPIPIHTGVPARSTSLDARALKELDQSLKAQDHTMAVGSGAHKAPQLSRPSSCNSSRSSMEQGEAASQQDSGCVPWRGSVDSGGRGSMEVSWMQQPRVAHYC